MAKQPPDQAKQKQPQAKPTREQKAEQRAAAGLPWHPAWRWLASLLVSLHLVAVLSAPWDLITEAALPPGFIPPTDNLGRQVPPERLPEGTFQEPLVTRNVHKFFHDYLNLLYLNHGYEFFAPDPAGTHVIDYRVNKSDGTTFEGRFPSLADEWPRLLYHRHMMLAEQTELMGPESGQHYADYLATRYGGTCQMQWKIHTLLRPEQVIQGMPLDDPSTYHVIGTVEGRPRAVAPSESLPAQGPIAIPGGGQ